MRISDIFVDGFGIFHNLPVENLPPRVYPLFGRQRGGQIDVSLVHTGHAVRLQGQKTERQCVPSPLGRDQGGRLFLVSRRFGRISLERRAGKKGGLVSVTHPDGRKAGEEALQELLGTTTRELYRNVYAFGLSELQSMETLDNDAVRSALYGAGMGTGVALSTAMAAIGRRLDAPFKPGGRSPELNGKLRKLEEVRGKLHESRRELKRYDEAFQALQIVSKVIEGHRAAMAASRREKEHVDTLLTVWDDAAALEALEQELADLPATGDAFPSKGIERLDRLEEKIETQAGLCAALAGEREAALRELHGLHADERLLERSGQVRELLSGKTTYAADCAAVPLLRQQIGAAVSSIATALSGLGRDWTEEKVLSLDRSLFAREEIERQRQALGDLRARRVNAENGFAGRKADLDAAVRDEEEAARELEKTPEVEKEADGETIARLQEGRGPICLHRRRLAAGARGRDNQREELKRRHPGNRAGLD